MEVLPGGKLLFLNDSSLLPWHTGDTPSVSRRPASTLKTPSLSLCTTSDCILDYVARQCAENVQTETRQRPLCGSATVLHSQREDKRVAIISTK